MLFSLGRFGCQLRVLRNVGRRHSYQAALTYTRSDLTSLYTPMAVVTDNNLQYNHSFHSMFRVMEHALVIVSPLRRSVTSLLVESPITISETLLVTEIYMKKNLSAIQNIDMLAEHNINSYLYCIITTLTKVHKPQSS